MNLQINVEFLVRNALKYIRWRNYTKEYLGRFWSLKFWKKYFPYQDSNPLLYTSQQCRVKNYQRSLRADMTEPCNTCKYVKSLSNKILLRYSMQPSVIKLGHAPSVTWPKAYVTSDRARSSFIYLALIVSHSESIWWPDS